MVNNIDPMQEGRLQVQVPDVPGVAPSTWAMPCFPLAGKQIGLCALPQIGAGVWVEFEQGDPDYPIWSGCWFGQRGRGAGARARRAAGACRTSSCRRTAQNTLMISDVPGPTGGILLKTTTGAMISINDIGITISNGKGAIDRA